MLKSMRELADKKIFKSILGIVLISFIIVGISDIFRNDSQDIVALIDGKYKITHLELKQQIKNEIARIKNSSGLQLNEEQIAQLNLKKITLEQIINRKLLEIESDKLGLKLSDKTIVDFLKNQEIFKDEQGNFDRNKFDNILNSINIKEASYLNLIKNELGAQFLIEMISNQFINPDLFTPYYYFRRNQVRLIDLITADPKDLIVKDPIPTPEEIKKYYDDNMKLFASPEYRSFSYLEILSKNMKITVNEDELKKEYNDSIDDYQNKKFIEVKELIKNKLIKQKSDAKLYEMIEVIQNQLASGDNIEEIAKNHQLNIVELVDIDRDGKNKEQALKINDSDMLNIVFSNNEIATSDVTMKSDDSGFYIFKLNNITPSSIKDFDSVKKQANSMLVSVLRKNLALNTMKEIKKHLNNGNKIELLPYKLTVNHNVRLMFDDANLPSHLISNIFQLKPKEISEIFEFKDKIIIAILKSIDNKKLDKADQSYLDLNNQIKSSLINDIIEDYFIYLRKKHQVKIYTEYLLN